MPVLTRSPSQHRLVYIGNVTSRMTSTTLDGAQLDLSRLTGLERRFFDLCIAAYDRDRLDSVQFTNLVWSRVNPLVTRTG